MAVSLPLSKNAVNRRGLAGTVGFGPFAYRWQDYPELAAAVHQPEPLAVSASLDSMDGHDLEHSLSMLSMPVLLVQGGKDPLVKPIADGLVDPSRYNTRLVQFEESRHFPMIEERSKFFRLMKDFFFAGDDLRSLELKAEWRRRTR